MSLKRHPWRPRSVVLGLTLALTVGALGTTAAQAQVDPPHITTIRTAEAPHRTSAQDQAAAPLSARAKAHLALTHLQQVLAPTGAAAARREHGGSAPDATLAFRDAWAQRGSMSPADRAAFDKANGRPVKSHVKCSDVVCVHWSPGETKTKFAMLALKIVTHVHKTYVRAGYRGPKPDGKLGGNAKTDVYLDDIGAQRLYGYCTTDQQRLSGPGRYDVWAYCVLDNNFSHAEFPTNTPVENLEVTAAHEYFHANQFAYDILDDRWFLEATATWAEDQLYDGVNDNLQYLVQSPLTQPTVSLDNGGNGNLGVYGRWIFFRYITEHFRAKRGTLPKIMLEFWQTADSSRGPKHNQYSSQAINTVLKRHGSSLAKVFAQFSDANLRPAKTYSEGRANHYPSPSLKRSTFVLTPSKKATGSLGIHLNHLASASAALLSRGFGKNAKIRVTFNLANISRGSRAVVTTYFKNGKTLTKLARLSGKGGGKVFAGFGSAKVVGVAVTLVNASARFRCHRGTGFSCSGKPLDQNVVEAFSARVI